MYILSLEKINELNEEIKNRIPILDYNSHLYASSINLLISGNYYEGYRKYREFTKAMDCIDKQLDLKIINFASIRLLHMKMFNEARTILEENINLYPNELSLNNNLAIVLFNLKEHKSAFDRLKLALDLDPNNVGIKSNYEKLANYLSLEGKL